MQNENMTEIKAPEKKRSRREWVKTAAIIFLAVLLVLTFFSQTIMNWSLPEVSGEYAGWGEINTSIRGSGTVEANMAYNIKIDSTREIKSVLVKKGDHIEAGQAIFTLDEADSEELKAAKEQLENLQYDYSAKLIQTLPADYAQTNKEIANMREDLEKAKQEKASIKTNEDALRSAKAAVASAQRTVDDLTEQIADLEGQIAELESGAASGNSGTANYLDALNKAKAELTAARTELEIANSNYQIAQLENKTPPEDSREIARLEALISAIDSEIALLNKERDGLTDDVEIARIDALINDKNAERQTAVDALKPLQDREDDRQKKIDDAAKAVNDAQIKVSRCEQAVYTAQSNFDKAVSSVASSLKPQLDTAKFNLKAANLNLKAAQDTQAEAESMVTVTVEQAEENIKNLQRQLESAIIALQSQQKTDGVTSKLNNLDLERARKAIAEQQKTVDALSGKGEGSEVVSKYAGTVTAINFIAGDTAPAGEALAEIDVDGKGYTLKIPVSNEKSQQVKVGDKASVSDYWWGDLDIVLAAIRSDTSNPGKGKILEFDVTGSAEVGQTLNISVGNKKTSYELVVPNSAVREDSNGTFILIAKAKSTPLGNRYIATRVDVKVIAKDNYKTAIDTGSSYGYDYVITTATKPVEAGSQVRLVENG
ncbi:MAG: biotin/lipoyl-binding protein [Oscillospiraceae bacterium]|nr:biotin/lipoyl-binding protein [Oscillospiraceae bacterium]